MRICSKCKLAKSEEEFSFKNKQRKTLSPYCKICNREYNRQHYLLNKQSYIDKAKVWDAKNKKLIYTWIKEYCLLNPCVDCGENDFIVIHFDHINIKNFTISSAINSRCYSILNIQKEITENCVPRCANCHAKRTAIQFNYYSFLD